MSSDRRESDEDDPLRGIEQRRVTFDKESLHQVLLGTGGDEAHVRVGVDHCLDHCRERLVKVHDCLKLVENEGRRPMLCLFGEDVEENVPAASSI